MNTCILSGHLGHDPSLRTTPTGKLTAQFSLALDNEGREGETSWVRVTAWDKQAEFCDRHIKKGRKVLVTGRLVVRKFEKADGSQGVSVEIDGARVEFMDSRPPEQGAEPAQPPRRQGVDFAKASDDYDRRRRGGELAAATAGARPVKLDDPEYFDDDVSF